MELRHLRYFAAVAESGHFSRAARACRVAGFLLPRNPAGQSAVAAIEAGLLADDLAKGLA